MPDLHSAWAGTVKGKDKRTLVLFLLGLLLLVWDFWPKAKVAALHTYGIALGDAAQSWQLLSFPLTGFSDETEMKTVFSLSEEAQVLPLVPGQGAGEDTPASLSLFFNRPLPINRADKAALEMLPGVGPHLADAILAELHRQGRFAGPDDLLEVSGIGPKNLQSLLPLLTFE